MTIKQGFTAVMWMVPGVAMLLLILLMVFHYYRGQDTAAQMASKAQRVELVAGMRLDLASASVAEKSTVVAVADRDAQTFVDQARTAIAAVERKHRQLVQLLSTTGTTRERELLSHFEKTFGDFQTTDRELLSLAVKNTNTKAFNLAFGPAAAAVQDMEVELSRVATKGSGTRDAQKLERLACDARIGVLHIQALLAPHVAEKSDERMDELEAQMTKEDDRIKTDLAGLEHSSSGPNLDRAEASYARFGDLRARILAFSRENTNIRSLAISLDQDAKAMLLCQEALAALQQAISEEPVAGVTYAKPARPR